MYSFIENYIYSHFVSFLAIVSTNEKKGTLYLKENLLVYETSYIEYMEGNKMTIVSVET